MILTHRRNAPLLIAILSLRTVPHSIGSGIVSWIRTFQSRRVQNARLRSATTRTIRADLPANFDLGGNSRFDFEYFRLPASIQTSRCIIDEHPLLYAGIEPRTVDDFTRKKKNYDNGVNRIALRSEAPGEAAIAI